MSRTAVTALLEEKDTRRLARLELEVTDATTPLVVSSARLGPTLIRYDLSQWAGQTVRLRFAAVSNQAPLRAGVDNVRLIPFERN